MNEILGEIFKDKKQKIDKSETQAIKSNKIEEEEKVNIEIIIENKN